MGEGGGEGEGCARAHTHTHTHTHTHSSRVFLLLMRMSMRPNSAMTLSTHALTLSSERRSTLAGRARTPRASTSWATVKMVPGELWVCVVRCAVYRGRMRCCCVGVDVAHGCVERHRPREGSRRVGLGNARHAARDAHDALRTCSGAQQRMRTQSTRECFGEGHGISPGRVGCGSVVFAATTTLQPAAASFRQHTRPMPRDPPVTMATRPLRSRLPLSSWVRTSVTFCIRGRLMAREACCAQEEA